MHSILARILTPLAGKRSGEREIDAADDAAAGAEATGGAAAAERRDRYTLCALQCLIEAAGRYGTLVAPVRWGWCRCVLFGGEFDYSVVGKRLPIRLMSNRWLLNGLYIEGILVVSSIETTLVHQWR